VGDDDRDDLLFLSVHVPLMNGHHLLGLSVSDLLVLFS
jgi:hypothetical protein